MLVNLTPITYVAEPRMWVEQDDRKRNPRFQLHCEQCGIVMVSFTKRGLADRRGAAPSEWDQHLTKHRTMVALQEMENELDAAD